MFCLADAALFHNFSRKQIECELDITVIASIHKVSRSTHGLPYWLKQSFISNLIETCLAPILNDPPFFFPRSIMDKQFFCMILFKGKAITAEVRMFPLECFILKALYCKHKLPYWYVKNSLSYLTLTHLYSICQKITITEQFAPSNHEILLFISM